MKVYQTQYQPEAAPRTKLSVPRAKRTPPRTKCAATLSSHRQFSSKATRKDRQISTSVPSKARRVKHENVTSGDPTALPAVRIVKHTVPADSSSSRDPRRPDSHLASRTTKHLEHRLGGQSTTTSSTAYLASSVANGEEDEEIEKFYLCRDGYLMQW